MPIVFLVKELSYVPDGVTIEGLTATGREGHGNNTACHVSQVQVKMVINVAALVLRDLR